MASSSYAYYYLDDNVTVYRPSTPYLQTMSNTADESDYRSCREAPIP